MSYFDDNEDYLIYGSRNNNRQHKRPEKPQLYIEDYIDVQHEINPCPKCGKAPERNNCGPEYQAIDCYECGLHADCDDVPTGNAKLISAIKNWNAGKIEEYKGENDGK